MTVSQLPAPRLTVEEAAERLEAMGQPFIFFADIRTGRGCLIYGGPSSLVLPPLRSPCSVS